MRNKLIFVFVAAALAPTAALLWTSVALIEHSLSYMGMNHLDQLSQSLHEVAREYYRQSCENLKREAGSAQMMPVKYDSEKASVLPDFVRQFDESKEQERFELSRPEGSLLYYLVRRSPGIWVYSKTMNGVQMETLNERYRQARAQVERNRQRDLRKGFVYTLVLLSIIIWVPALGIVLCLSNRISRPIRDLTTGLHRLAGGDFDVRLMSRQKDEIGLAIQAFNDSAGHLRRSRDRLVYLTQVASWQLLARKMAHELKNSLTPIRLTVEEITVRAPSVDRQFLEQAAEVVIGEVESLERRVRAFSEFAAEPQTCPSRIDLNALVEERIHFLEIAHPDIRYVIEKSEPAPEVWADPDHVKGILTNLVQNAAEAAGDGGAVRIITGQHNGRLSLEVHDSGPGLSEEAQRSLFEPSISFKQHGMGLGLSISRKNALLAGGDLEAIDGLMGGAGFRLVLPIAKESHGRPENPDCRR